MNVPLDTSFKETKKPGSISINGFPPCNSNIKRIQKYDMEDHFIKVNDLSKILNYIYPNLYDIDNNTDTTAWSETATEVLSYLYNKNLDDKFISSCNNNNSNSIYNTLIFLQYNGTILKSCWGYLDRQSCSRINIACNNAQVYKLDYIRNISPILTSQGLIDSEGESISIDKSINIIKNHIIHSPLIANFIVQQSLCLNDNQISNNPDWNIDKIYISNSNSPIIGYHNALIVGWGISTQGIPYWIMKNNWGNNWIQYNDIPQGYWKHAMYPYNKISCVDISIHGNLIPSLPWSDRQNPLGGVISLSLKDKPRIENLDINKFIPVSIIKNIEEQHSFIYLITLLFLIAIFYLFFRGD